MSAPAADHTQENQMSKHQRIVTIAESTSYLYEDRDTGVEYRIDLPKGRQVLALVPGIARPTYQGGGLHGQVVDLDTGTELRAIFTELTR